MIVNVPINFDNPVNIAYKDGDTEFSPIFPASKGMAACTFSKINGYDAGNNRVTNLVGYDGSDFIKRCPKCKLDKQVIEFGYRGRFTNRRRDQSQCTPCRGNHKIT